MFLVLRGACRAARVVRRKRSFSSSYSGADMVLTFLGTGSTQPSETRGVSCTALKLPCGETWLFDVGESSQLQFQRSYLRPSKVTKIFITHLHGDHTFGLPGILCMLGSAAMQTENTNAHCIDIYGPEGIRDFIRVTLQLSQSKIAVHHRIHELKGLCASDRCSISTTISQLFGERKGGREIFPRADGSYLVMESNDAMVYAAQMKHTVPCVGYVIQEKVKTSRLKIDAVRDIMVRNKDAIEKEYNFNNAFQLSRKLKLLNPGDIFTFPDGTVVRADDVLETVAPRKIVLLGDTSDAADIAPLAEGADVLVHEATNAWFEGGDFGKQSFESEEEFTKCTMERGHSTPQIAGNFAKIIGARKLILTHFSGRYDGDDEERTSCIMRRIESIAAKASGMKGEDVIAAKDFLAFPVQRMRSDASINN